MIRRAAAAFLCLLHRSGRCSRSCSISASSTLTRKIALQRPHVPRVPALGDKARLNSTWFKCSHWKTRKLACGVRPLEVSVWPDGSRPGSRAAGNLECNASANNLEALLRIAFGWLRPTTAWKLTTIDYSSIKSPLCPIEMRLRIASPAGPLLSQAEGPGLPGVHCGRLWVTPRQPVRRQTRTVSARAAGQGESWTQGDRPAGSRAMQLPAACARLSLLKPTSIRPGHWQTWESNSSPCTGLSQGTGVPCVPESQSRD